MKNKKIIISVAIIAIVALIMWKLGFVGFITDINGLQKYIESLGVWGYLFYIFVYILVAIFSLPASVVTIVAGLVFGPVKGGIIALIGATIGATMAFLIARYIARDTIVNKFGKNKIFIKIEDGVAKNGKDFLILTRLVPIFPYNLQNYAYGVTNMKVTTFAFISLICMAPGAFIFAYLAGEIATNGVSKKLLLELIVAGICLFAVSQIPKILAKKKGIKIDD